MEFNINNEMQKAFDEMNEAKEIYDKAKGKVEYLQSIIHKMNEENSSGVISQQNQESISSIES